MHRLNPNARSPYLEVLRRQKEVWELLIGAIETSWNRGFSMDWRVDPRISPEEVVADLTYGRD